LILLFCIVKRLVLLWNFVFSLKASRFEGAFYLTPNTCTIYPTPTLRTYDLQFRPILYNTALSAWFSLDLYCTIRLPFANTTSYTIRLLSSLLSDCFRQILLSSSCFAIKYYPITLSFWSFAPYSTRQRHDSLPILQQKHQEVRTILTLHSHKGSSFLTYNIHICEHAICLHSTKQGSLDLKFLSLLVYFWSNQIAHTIEVCTKSSGPLRNNRQASSIIGQFWDTIWEKDNSLVGSIQLNGIGEHTDHTDHMGRCLLQFADVVSSCLYRAKE
jgi:hypothetical protein